MGGMRRNIQLPLRQLLYALLIPGSGVLGGGVAVLPIPRDIVAFRLRVIARLTDNSSLASGVPAATLLTAPAFSVPCAYNNGLLFLVSL